MKYMWFWLFAMASFVVSCGPNSSNDALDDSSYSSFFGENELEDEVFGEETLMVEFHPTIEGLESDDSFVAEVAPESTLEPVIQEEATLANQVQSALEVVSSQVQLMQQDEVAVQEQQLPLEEKSESESVEGLASPSNIN